MSYVSSDYYRNPGPYYAGPDFDAPVPGWGLLPNVAGGARVGVGQLTNAAAPTVAGKIQLSPGIMQAMLPSAPSPSRAGGGSGRLPAWSMWLVGGALLGVGVAYGKKEGWF